MKKNNNPLDDSLKLIAKTSIIVFIGLVMSKLLGYAYRIIVARYYGPEVYGLFSLVTMVLGIILAVSSLGLLDGLARFIPQYRGKKESNRISYLLKLTNKILLVTGIISAVLLFFLSEFIAVNIFHDIDLVNLLKILSFFVPIAVLSSPFLNALRGYELISSYSFVYNILQNLVRVLTLVILVVLGCGASSSVVSYCIGFLAVLITSYLICKYKLPELFVKSNLSKQEKTQVRKSFFSYSFPLMFFSIASMLFYWIDSFFLGYFKGAESVGFYNAAVPIALMLSMIPELFMQLFFPMINRHYSNKDFELIKQVSKQLGKWIFMVNLPLFILIFVFPGAAINILFGSPYLVSENALRILIFGSFIASIGTISNNLLSMAGKSKLVLMDMVIACLVNVILNFILIPMPVIMSIDNSLGINGAALATALSMVFLNMLFFFQAKKSLGIIPIRIKMISILFIGLISGFLLMYLRSIFSSSNIFLIVVLTIGFLGVYSFLVLISKSLDYNDWSIISAIYRKIRTFS
ncbi:MAG: flippase [Candidatus Pacearchaeota archaeon]|jgi:O-antigen/teichoic acid export membrane protein